MATANNSVRVEIYDQAYNLRGSDADYILKLAEYVDTKNYLVHQLEAAVDAETERPLGTLLPSGDELAAELERFLRGENQ